MAFDVAIIGGGPGGYTAADEAARRGLSTVLFEAGKLGGTCLNRGCIPTKALLHDAEAGVSDPAVLRGRRDAVVDTLRTGIAKLMKTRKVTVVEGFAKVVAPGTISCNGETYEARDIIVATGSVPSVPPIPGADLPGVYTSNDLLEGESPLPASIAIVGGGVIGMELALFFALAGSEVHVLEAMERILPGNRLCVCPLLRRVKNTRVQKQLSMQMRRENMRGACEVDRRMAEELWKLEAYRKAPLLLVDDIYTTGSTIEEAAETLGRELPGRRIGFFCLTIRCAPQDASAQDLPELERNAGSKNQKKHRLTHLF